MHVALDTRARIGTMQDMDERMPLFRSFWMTGFDGADHMSGAASLDAADASQYRRRVDADYRAVRDAGIACVRESIDWRRVSRGERLDFSTVTVRAECARAALAACDAILEVVPHARFVHVEPIVSARSSGSDARIGGDSQFEVWDMLSGRLEPELGGRPRYLDVIGVHHHHSIPSRRGAAPGGAIAADRSRFMLHQLLSDIHARYGRPIVVCETNHESAVRAAWLREFGDEIGEALLQGIPVQGACLCRAVARPTWEDPRYWRGRRLRDVLLQPADDAPRASGSAYGRAPRDVQARIGPLLADRHREGAP